eukprot:COSAG03_NODE_20763_length_314_cov_0.716279_1_plen_51_part_10
MADAEEPAAKKLRATPSEVQEEPEDVDELDAAAEAVALARKQKVVRSGREC